MLCINYICTYICLSVCQCLGIPEERFGFPGAQVTGGCEPPRVTVGAKLRSSGRTSPLNCWAICPQSRIIEGQSTCKMTTEELAGKGRSRGRRHQQQRHHERGDDITKQQCAWLPIYRNKVSWISGRLSELYPGDFQEKLKSHGRDRSVCTYVCCAGLSALNTCLFTLVFLRFIYFICLGGVGIYKPWHMRGHQRKIGRTRSSPSITWLAGIEPWSSHVVASPSPAEPLQGPLDPYFHAITRHKCLAPPRVGLRRLCLWMKSGVPLIAFVFSPLTSWTTK